jgi:hypothetical protein
MVAISYLMLYLHVLYTHSILSFGISFNNGSTNSQIGGDPIEKPNLKCRLKSNVGMKLMYTQISFMPLTWGTNVLLSRNKIDTLCGVF